MSLRVGHGMEQLAIAPERSSFFGLYTFKGRDDPWRGFAFWALVSYTMFQYFICFSSGVDIDEGTLLLLVVIMFLNRQVRY